MIKISVIIPVYNVEKYLKECLDSVINQTLKEIEIICIDDCSTDNSYEILEEYAKKDTRITILKNEQNSGVGYTRNVGEKIAKGEYLYFIDPDDYIELNFLTLMYNTAKKYDCDIVNTNNVYTNKDGIISPYYINVNDIIYKKIEKEYEVNIDLQSFDSKIREKRLTYNLWTKLFRRNFLVDNNLFSPENKIGAAYDADLLVRIIINNPKTVFNTEAKYFYRIRNDSITYNIKSTSDKIIYIIENCKNIEKYCKEKRPELIYNLYSNLWHFIMFPFTSSMDNDKKDIYTHIYNYSNQINLTKDITNDKDYREYLLIKSNDTYEKYLLSKEMLEKNNNINNRLNELDKKINNINNRLNELDKKINNINSGTSELNNILIKKLDKRIKIFGIDKLSDRKIIYIFGIKITIKKK